MSGIITNQKMKAGGVELDEQELQDTDLDRACGATKVDYAAGSIGFKDRPKTSVILQGDDGSELIRY